MIKKLTLRKAFHDLINKNGNMMLPAELAAEDLKVLLTQSAGNLDQEIKKSLEQTIEDLKDIENSSKQADSLIKQIKDFVYAKLDPDQNELTVEV